MKDYNSRTAIVCNDYFFSLLSHQAQEQPVDDNTTHDEDYQSLFRHKGCRKAMQVLSYVDQEYRQALNHFQSITDEDLVRLRRSTAIVSIGGADGSELHTLMNELGSPYGILVEISPAAADLARANGIDIVIENDVIDGASEVVTQLLDWKASHQISSVLISCQSVLHELPTRSCTFTMETFSDKYLLPLINRGLRVMFYAREPCPPRNWLQTTDAVALRLFGLSKQHVKRLAQYIAMKLNIPWSDDLTDELDDEERIILPVVLAQELLFKMIYWKDLAHFQYEMGEQLTSFRPETWLYLLKQWDMQTTCRYLTTNHFTQLYQNETNQLDAPVAINPYDGSALDMPECFVELFASTR